MNMCNTTCARNLKDSDSSCCSVYDLFCDLDEQVLVRIALQSFSELNSIAHMSVFDRLVRFLKL